MPWADEDEQHPGARALFYTAGDLYEDGEGTIHYDGEDDGAAAAAVEFYRQIRAGQDATGEVKVGTGGKRTVSLAEKLGIKTRWVKHELAPGIQIRVQRGTKVAVANTGTAQAPVFVVTPGVRVGGTVGPYTGVVPLIALLVKGGAGAAAKVAARKAEAARKEQHVAPGQSIEIGGVMGLDDLEPGELGDTAAGGASSACVMCGALLIDSDGRKIRI